MTKRKVEIVVISDVHLGTFGSRATELMLYLESVEPETLIINGDLIDIWQFRKRYFPKSHLAILQKIINLTSNGVTTYFLPGNHDDLIRKFGDFSIGNFHVQNELILNINNQKVWFHHGDKYDASVRNQSLAAFGGYLYEHLILVENLFNRFLKLFKIKPFQIAKKIKMFSKRMSKKSSNFELKAFQESIEKGCDIMICGHVHKPQKRIFENKNGKILYLNSGDWVENLSALEYNSGEWKVLDFDETLFGTDFELINKSTFQ